jgi:hypothetical protein
MGRGSSKPNWDRPSVIAVIRRLGPQRFTVARDRHTRLLTAAGWYFGSWDKAIEAAGFEYPAAWRHFTLWCLASGPKISKD